MFGIVLPSWVLAEGRSVDVENLSPMLDVASVAMRIVVDILAPSILEKSENRIILPKIILFISTPRQRHCCFLCRPILSLSAPGFRVNSFPRKTLGTLHESTPWKAINLDQHLL